MDSSVRASTLLPTIKCSTCSSEIEISRLGDHVCAAPTPSPKPPMDLLNAKLATMNANLGNAPSHFRLGRIAPSRIDADAANRPFIGPERSTQTSNFLQPWKSPLAPKGQSAPFQMPPRSATLPERPPSSNFQLPQDSAFPMFPTPSTQKKPRSRSQSRVGEEPLQPLRSRSSTKSEKSEESLKRSQTTKSVTSSIYESENGSPQRGLSRNATTAGARTQSRPYGPEEPMPTLQQRPSTARADMKRKSSFSSLAGMLKGFKSKGDDSAVEDVPPLPLNSADLSGPKSPARTAPLMGGFVERPPRLQSPEKQAERAARLSPLAKFPPLTAPVERKQSQPQMHIRGPSTASVNRPLNEIGSTRMHRTGPSISSLTPGSFPRSASASGDRSDHKGLQAPPLPNSDFLKGIDGPRSASAMEQRTRQNAFDSDLKSKLDTKVEAKYQTKDETKDEKSFHTPTESMSSTGSSRSDIKTSSSASSPPRPESNRSSKDREAQPIDQLRQDIQANMAKAGEPAKDPLLSRRANVKSFSRPSYAKPMDLSEAILELTPNSSEFSSPTSVAPVVELTKSSPATNTSPLLLHSPPITPEASSPQPEDLFGYPPSHKPLQSPNRRPAHKGNCRGCGELIKGKSVSSADGRLTGRYHRDCFVCTTCKEPFKTADFYVHNNLPYCHRHYHEVNNSLCTSCDRGIEGQYIETDTKQKFHSHCFVCRDCYLILRDNYFEVNGKTYCEQHAFRPEFLGPGRRFPEKRTTRLMMML